MYIRLISFFLLFCFFQTEARVHRAIIGAQKHAAFQDKEVKGVDLNGEIQISSPNSFKAIGYPSPHFGFHLNFRGETSQAYTGLTWHLPLPNSQCYFEPTFGGCVHNGRVTSKYKRFNLGTRFLFRESISFGYKFRDNQALSIMFDHASNAGISSHNPGINTFGIRYNLFL